jgi:UDP-3-O-[3-hydroxymyristoyl] glucosamine N-acyltransferase
MTLTLGELAVRFGCELRGDPAALVDSVAALSNAGARSITFLANPKLAAQLKDTRAGAVITDAGSAAGCPVPVLIAGNPHATFARVAALLYPEPPVNPGVHPTAVLAPDARIDPAAEVAAHAVIGARARIGARSYVGPGSIVQHDAVVGDDTRLVARAFIGHGVLIGARCIIQPGAVIGGDGFGFARENGTWVKVPQIGSVTIGDDAEVGANTCIDRGAIEDTVIEEGVKLDNLIMIGHNCRIGAHSALAGHVGIAGSTTLGKRCIIGGQVGITGHVTLSDDVAVLGSSFISHSIGKPGVYSSALPSEEAGPWRRIVARIKRLDGMAKRLRAVEKHVGFSAQDQDSSED